MSIPAALERLAFRYPSVLVDAVTRYEPGRRIAAVKNVTVSEEFFQGHFPGLPLMPGVLMIESLTQVATLLLLGVDDEQGAGGRAWLRGVGENTRQRGFARTAWADNRDDLARRGRESRGRIPGRPQ